MKESYIEIKNSKFYGYLYNINSINEIDSIIKNIKLKHKKAKHVVYAYKLGILEKRFNSTEPSFTAGEAILDIIHKKDLDNTLIVVVRYFGGTLLGRGLLKRSYLKCASSLFNV